MLLFILGAEGAAGGKSEGNCPGIQRETEVAWIMEMEVLVVRSG